MERKTKRKTCADGRPQRWYITKEYTSLPTIYLEDLFTSLIIDAHEGKYVTIFYVPGAYLNTKIPKNKFILLKIEEEFLEIMCKVNPKLKKSVRVENGVKVIYLSLMKDLYGWMEYATLWYDLY